MRFSITRLCGGKALMVAPRDTVDIDLRKAAGILSDIGVIGSADDMMLTMSWNGMEVTVYAQGKIMFHPLDSRDDAVAYTNTLLEMLVG
ncbi:MAG: hypothetical protein LBH69_00725 [Methanomassiliicoccaceae archaeon]|jgi:hypothetical protein|nr:hypothetical protein [Methanomassiliicoccaceae archaeon]